MKVLHFYRTYLPDTVAGIPNVMFQLCEGSRVLGIDADVLTLTPNTDKAGHYKVGHHTVHAGISLFEIASTNFSLDVFPLFNSLIKETDIVHYHYPWPFMDLLYLSLGRHKKSVVSYHSDIVKQKRLERLYGGLRSAFLSRVDRIVATCQNYQDSSDILADYKEKTTLIPYGLDETTYPAPDMQRVNHFRDRFGTGFFLFVGVLRYYKGLNFLIEAAHLNKLPVVIAGDGPCKNELQELTEHLGATNVHFIGHVNETDKMALLQACLAFVFPSHVRSEAFGISLLEAAMSGKPMISCEIQTGTSFVNLQGETGLVVEPGSPSELAAAMQQVASDPALARRFGACARRRFESVFTADQMCSAYATVYQEVLGSKASR
jgi:glycosyltransferase involved in cell wall biosynthesis